MVGIDGSAGSLEALDWATDQAAREHRPLTLLHGADPVAFAGGGDYPGAEHDYTGLRDEVRQRDVAMLEAATARVRARHPDVEVGSVLSGDDPRNALLQLGETAAMVVLGSRGLGPVASLLLGSVSVAVSRHATCPVVVLRPDSLAGGGVMVGVDGTEHSLPAVEFAFGMASLRGCPLTVVHCYRDPAHRPGGQVGADGGPDLGEEEALTAEALAGMGEKFPDVPVDVHLVPGRGARELLAASEGFALLVVGHHRRAPLHGLLHDPVATTLLEHARCPVAVVPSL